METLVSQRIEEVVNTVDGIDQLRSVSGQGTSFVMATFNLNRDIEAAAQDVRDRVQGVTRLFPPGTDPPIVQKFDNERQGIMTISLSSNRARSETICCRLVIQLAASKPRCLSLSAIRKRTGRFFAMTFLRLP